MLVNRVRTPPLPEAEIDDIADGRIDAGRIKEHLAEAGFHASDADVAGLLTETIDYARRHQAQQIARASSTTSTCRCSIFRRSATGSIWVRCMSWRLCCGRLVLRWLSI